MGDLVDRVSRVVLSEDEIRAQMAADGKTPEGIDAVMAHRSQAIVDAQAKFDKAPPKFYRPVPPE